MKEVEGKSQPDLSIRQDAVKTMTSVEGAGSALDRIWMRSTKRS